MVRKTKNIQGAAFLWTECLVDVRGQRRMVRLISADRNAMVTQITTLKVVSRKASRNAQHIKP